MTAAPLRWAVVVPVKGNPEGKTRLEVGDGLRNRLAVAFGLDTVRAALSAESVRDVLVVCPPDLAGGFAALGARVLTEQTHGLNAALRRGITATDGRLGRALLLGDVPALRPEALARALAAASAVPRAMVPDAARTGTVLATARPGIAHRPRFGSGSRRAHLDAGYRELLLPDLASLRADVDTVADLTRVAALRAGPATAAALAALPPSAR